MTDAWRPTATTQALQVRSDLLRRIRDFFHLRDVIEVHTPVLGSRTVSDPAIQSVRTDGGFLQTSPEYFMKRLLAAGVPSCYQIGPVFREGETGRWHNPEFTMLEWYRLGFEAAELRKEVADLVDTVLGEGAYKCLTFDALFQSEIGSDIHDADNEELLKLARQNGFVGVGGRSEIRDFLYAQAIDRVEYSRLFVIDFPEDAAALARLKTVNQREVADRFELIVDGIEIANGYHELLDADEFERRFNIDNDRRRSMSLPSVKMDERFLAAMRHGLPPCAGVAVGLDRLFALAMGVDSIAAVTAFPSDRA